MTFGFTFFDQVMTLVAALSTVGAIWAYFYAHPTRKQRRMLRKPYREYR
jgi:hypothetical protein